ncbi:YlbL family protein [Pengzhenrongella sicca]|uniref:endopeptidase La n=1 Tax=Pengzhenrongella sicca TaxID=2819238 RepID=A0A8A4ZDN8_9MICO|nr:S16 family serine protease [Pengzhenrongella sicca]QTE30024.1 PDZ domain-containing protein [Pengzhenrongella sicca]
MPAPDRNPDLNPGSEPTPAEPPFHDAGTPDNEPPVDDVVVARPAPSPRSTTLSIAVLVTLVLCTVGVFVPLPYAIGSPGPTRDTLGEQDGTPLIDIQDAETFDSTGELRMTTVSFSGGPGYPVTLPMVLQAWVSGTRVVSPVESVFPPARSQEDIDEENTAEMVSSQENATVAALEELGYEVPAQLVVAGAVEGTGAVGVVQEGDVVVTLQGEALTSYTALVTALAAIEPGETVALGIERDGAPLDVQIVTGERETGGSQLGVYIDPTFDLPIDVTIEIEDIGGPSAGTMFALGIIDKLTPEDEANGVVIAGTGTMDVDGTVGPIGGIRQKLAGARRDGATWFLAPADNCDEVVGNVPDGLSVAKVATLAEARAAMTAIGAGDGDSLETCTAD